MRINITKITHIRAVIIKPQSCNSNSNPESTPKFLCNIFASILHLVDKVFTGRISLGGYSLYYFGASLFGGNIDYSVYNHQKNNKY